MKQKLLLLFLIFLLPVVALAHSGGTDSKGGHYDRSTGQYHYHHGYSAHQHPNGVCPYERKETVTKGTTYSNSIISFPTATPRQIKVITALPTTTIIRASSITPRPSATAYLRPAVTVAPGGITTSTPRATAKATAPPRITSTASVSEFPYHIEPSTVDTASFDWKNILFFVIAFLSLWHTVLSSIKQRKEREKYYADLRILRRDLKQKEEYISSFDNKIILLEQNLQEAYDRINKLNNELEASHTPPPTPVPAPVLAPARKPVPSLLPDFPAPAVDISPKTLYMIKYPRTWRFIRNNALVPDSYVNYYHSVWGRLQANHGDGVIFDTLTDEEQAYVDYPPIGKNVYLTSVDSDTYHTTPNCYTLLKSNFIEVDASLTIVYKRCTKCVPPHK